ncbi:Efflux transporter, RND family, MFP subunit [Sulfitobacter noctilucicola]|uniref:RND family efflux transporter MFP subunit n=1 Tax=Sulfitobacter noctilucicola TaxID=1342301 RepID=A0A7W6M6R2_9RHOB|nr:HlyD family efflux transporter periplasmic adaptor subunit [Sulfitobacter noctilucicola]KIN62110.1 Efflux transporter, RND family, MFP subunit [Sulfitobacter noctilucicola]MBB4173371.1 RND family efflux transporter MFP subunit [Sulfitobacter noctilucicola]
MRFLRQSMIGLFLASITLGLLVFAVTLVGGALQERMAETSKAPPARERVFSVNVVTAQPQDVVPVLETFGEVQSRRLLELRAAVAGRVVELADGFEDGGEIKAGQVLVQLDPADAQAAVERADSDVADALAEGRDATRSLELALAELAATEDQAALRERAFERQQDLADRGVGTATTVETAELAASAARQAVVSRRQAVAQAEARLDQTTTGLARARLALAEAERRLEDTTLTAPFDGTLSSTSVVVGRLVLTNEQLAELIDPRDLEVSFRLSTAQYARLLDENGQILGADVTARLDVAGVDLEAQGRISRASAGAGEGATGRLVFAALRDAKGFKTGDFVTVRVQEPELKGVVRLPASAVDANNEVLVLGEENRLEAVEVSLLRRQGDEVLVRGPILERKVVEARSPLLGAGISVKPIERDAQVSNEPEMLELTEERRARLVAFVEGNTRMPEEAKARTLARLAEPQVPAQMVARIESRMGG